MTYTAKRTSCGTTWYCTKLVHHIYMIVELSRMLTFRFFTIRLRLASPFYVYYIVGWSVALRRQVVVRSVCPIVLLVSSSSNNF